MTAPPVSFAGRIGLALRVLFDGELAGRVRDASLPALPAPPAVPTAEVAIATTRERAQDPAEVRSAAHDRESGALLLLSLLQREGRLVDFLRQAIDGFPDADVGAAARVVHDGCRRALASHVEVVPVRGEAEGARVHLPQGFDAGTVRLTGDVKGAPPYDGVLRHAGWRAVSVRLPELAAGHDGRVLAQAEVEL